MRSFIALLILTLLTFACGDDDAPASTIGDPCGGEATCAMGEMCLAEQPGGLCTQTCTMPGETTECPSGSLCDTVNVTTGDGGVVDMILCLDACDDDTDCRTGYSCNGVSSGSGKVCRTE